MLMSTTITIMTFNIHHSEGLDGKINLPRIAYLIRDSQADLVSLNEVDKAMTRSQHLDIAAELAKMLQMNVTVGWNLNYGDGRYGNAILSKFPIVSASNTLLKKTRACEQRGLLKALVLIGRREVTFASTHLDSMPDDDERLSNVAQLSGDIIAGDFNAPPTSSVYTKISEHYRDAWSNADPGYTFGHRKKSRIDYMWIKKSLPATIISSKVIETDASDHRPVVVTLNLE